MQTPRVCRQPKDSHYSLPLQARRRQSALGACRRPIEMVRLLSVAVWTQAFARQRVDSLTCSHSNLPEPQVGIEPTTARLITSRFLSPQRHFALWRCRDHDRADPQNAVKRHGKCPESVRRTGWIPRQRTFSTHCCKDPTLPSRFSNGAARVRPPISRFVKITTSLLPPMPDTFASQFFARPRTPSRRLRPHWPHRPPGKTRGPSR